MTGTGPARDDTAVRYRSVLENIVDPGEPELLPIRLAEAAAAVLPVDGAGLSLFDADFRVPLGASDDRTSVAERLQFTEGDGPCLAAGREKRVIVSDEQELAGTWPVFAGELFARTPYRGVATMPLAITSRTRGAMDLFVVDSRRLQDLQLAAVTQVADEIVACLRSVTVAAEAAAAPRDPELPFLASPTAQVRTVVWLAMGMVMTRFDVPSTDALAVLRGYAFSTNALLDDIAAALVQGSLELEKLRP